MPKPTRYVSAALIVLFLSAPLHAQASPQRIAPPGKHKLQKLPKGLTRPRVEPIQKPTPKCVEVQKRHRWLRPIFLYAVAVQKKTNRKGEFLNWHTESQNLLKMVEQKRDPIQELVCANNVPLDPCVAPVQVHCEGLPFAVDTLAWEEKNLDEAERLAVGSDIVSGPRNFAERCCGDFGCTEGGVGWPYENEAALEDILKLSRSMHPLGEHARASIKLTADALDNAKCSCAAKREDKAVATWMAKHAKRASKSVRKDLNRTVRVLERGLPKAECKLPGY